MVIIYGDHLYCLGVVLVLLMEKILHKCGKHPITYMVLYTPACCLGFCPSTVCSRKSSKCLGFQTPIYSQGMTGVVFLKKVQNS